MPSPGGASETEQSPGLVDVEELRGLLKLPVDGFDAGAGALAARQATGWLSDATGLVVWPDPVPERLWAWALELAAIAYHNPTADNAETVGAVSTQFGDRQRRAEILAAARRAFPAATAGPLFSFPEPDWSWK